MPPFIELEQPWWNQFLRQMKAAAGSADEVKSMWARILEPMRAAWEHHLPGSLKRTAKVRKKAQSGEIWAGYPSTKGGTDGRPFLPWLEFGGTVKWKGAPTGQWHRVKLQSGRWRTRKVMFIRRPRVQEGRYRGPAVEGETGAVAQEFADSIQELLNKHFY